MFLYDIVQAYIDNNSCWRNVLIPHDETLEQLWNAQESPKEYDDILVIRDGSDLWGKFYLVIVMSQHLA